jgi:phosphate transport system protein
MLELATVNPPNRNEAAEGLLENMMHMGILVSDAITKAGRALLQGDQMSGRQVLVGDDEIDRMELAIARKCMDLLASSETLTDAEQRQTTAILKAITDLERIADLAEEIVLLSREISPPYPAKIVQRLRKMAEQTLAMIQKGMQAFSDGDLRDLHELREQEDIVNLAQRRLHAEIFGHIKETPDALKTDMKLLFASHNFGRMAAHATNLGEWAVYAATGGLGRLRSYRTSEFPAALIPLI